MKNSKIKSIEAREILDSRGEPTIEVELKTDLGIFRASVPSGASKGKYEAKELRDNGKRYYGKGVLRANKNINEIIAPKLKDKNSTQQKEIDELMIELDGTGDKSNLGANAILAVSIATCRAGAAAKNLSLWKHINQLSENGSRTIRLPRPCFNVMNGGAHAGNDLDIQEFMVLPREKSFSGNLQIGSEIYHTLKAVLRKELGEQATNIGDEGGFAPLISRTEEALNLIAKAIQNHQNMLSASLQDISDRNIKIGLDCAASQFYKDKKYQLEGTVFTKEGLLVFYQSFLKNYPIIFLEDPFSEEDWQGFQGITKELGERITIVGDDLLTTNIERIKKAQDKKACSGLILKPNQIGTITETLEAVKLAKSFRWKIIVSHRSGDTCDDFISDLAVGIGADFIKAGAPARGERVAKYNRLLRIEEELFK